MGWQRPGLRQQVVKKVLEAYFSHHLPCVTTFPPFQPQTTTSHTPLPWFFQHFHPSSSSSSPPPRAPTPLSPTLQLPQHPSETHWYLWEVFFFFCLGRAGKNNKSAIQKSYVSLPPVPSEVCLPPLPPLSPSPTSSFHPFIPLPGSPSQFPSRVKFPLVRNDTSAHSVTSFPPICTSKSHLPAHF